MSFADPQGRVALMLCESILHLLVEERVVTKEKALEAINTVAELTREMADGNPTIAPTSGRFRSRSVISRANSVTPLIASSAFALVMTPSSTRR
jgi:hypothetical protein